MEKPGTEHPRADPARRELRQPAWPETAGQAPPWRALAPLGAIWLLAAMLTIFAGAFDSYPAYCLGVLLMGIVLVITTAAVVSAHRLRTAEPVSLRPWRAGAVRVATALPLLVCGFVLVHVVGDFLDAAAMWWVPVAGSALFGNVVLLGLAGAEPVRAPGQSIRGAVLGATAAVAGGALIGALIVFAQRGIEQEWTTGHGLAAAFAEGTVGRAAQGDVTISGRLVDGEADYLAPRMYLSARFADGRGDSWEFYNKNGKGSAEPITDYRERDVDDIIVRGDATSIWVRVCNSRADNAQQAVYDIECGAPVEIWRH